MKDQFLHLIMKISDESSYILFHERAFSDVLGGVLSKTFSGGEPPNPLQIRRKKTILGHTCYLLAQM